MYQVPTGLAGLNRNAGYGAYWLTPRERASVVKTHPAGRPLGSGYDAKRSTPTDVGMFTDITSTETTISGLKVSYKQPNTVFARHMFNTDMDNKTPSKEWYDDSGTAAATRLGVRSSREHAEKDSNRSGTVGLASSGCCDLQGSNPWPLCSS